MKLRLLIFSVWAALACVWRVEAEAPVITAVQLDRTNVMVKVSVPAGYRKISIEGRSRLEGSAWAPKAVQRFDTATSAATEVVFSLPRAEDLEVLRIRADATEALPASFFRGTNQFAGGQSFGDMQAGGGPPRDGTGGNPSANGSGGAETREVVESDIWKVSGDTLYFFNNLRGLQVIDIANPAAPTVRGTFAIPAAGEQMYVLPSGHAVLLTHSWCDYSGSGDSARVMIVDAAGATPTLATNVSVTGWIVESRLVGSALYVVTQSYREVPNGAETTWEPGTLLTSIDLSVPAQPVTRRSAWLTAYGNTVMATANYLFTVTWNSDWTRSAILVTDISSPNGEFKPLATIQVAGRVTDKFKMNLDGDILTVISASWNDQNRWLTTLETYSLLVPTAPTRLGTLRLAEGEQLYATRFDGNRAYIVTYLRIDPLWIVDLSDPAHPTIKGELHVPGWSTYLHPMGDRLLALGVDDTNSWRVAVSLFDVQKIAEPKLLSKVVMGENSSWSEAQSDEKALTVLPAAGLVLVPWQGYTTNGYSGRVQLIDLGANTLTARGQLTDHVYPRRATVHRDHVISISGREFVSYDAADRDHPVLKAKLDLSWPVNRVLLAGEHLLEIENGSASYWGGGNAPATIRVAPANSPDRPVAAITFANGLQIAGADLKDGKLYVAQTRASYWGWFADDGGVETTGKFTLSIWDATHLPALTRLGETNVVLSSDFGSGLTPLWPRDGLLVWSGGGGGNWWGWGRPGAMMDIAWWPGWSGGGGGQLVAFDVSAAATPAFKSEVNLTTNGGWSFSKPFVAEGLVYLSHQAQEVITRPRDPTTGSDTNLPPVDWLWITRYFLDVVDYADAVNPLVRKPVNIPGALQGASHAGSVLYTLGYRYNADGYTDGLENLDASAYDGVAAFYVASLSLTNWPHPIAVNGGEVFVGQATTPNALERWRISDAGKFEKLSATVFASAPYSFRFIDDLLVLNNASNMLLLDARNRTDLKVIGQGGLPCYGSGDLANGDGALTRGFWMPRDDYGVAKTPLN